ncbi:MAG: DUF2490 domain-containing protein [Limisphaerales bacterium]
MIRFAPILVATLGCAVLLAVPRARAEDTFVRPSIIVNWYDSPAFRFQTYSEAQFADSEPRFNRWIQAERFTFKPWEHLWLGANYTITEKLGLNPTTHAEFAQDEHRLELEALPRLTLGTNARLNGRIRVERRWKDHAPDDWRFRMRWEPALDVQGCGPLREVFVQAEYLHDLSLNRSSEWRIVPAGTTWRITEHLNLRVFYMWDTVRARPDWAVSHILYTTWQYSFR